MKDRTRAREVAQDILRTESGLPVPLGVALTLAEAFLEPIPMLLWCPACGERHIEGELVTKPHHTHACQHCGLTWRPAVEPTAGVQFLPGFKDASPASLLDGSCPRRRG
jgi:hypothetical protein